jgi:hypothetical protein
MWLYIYIYIFYYHEIWYVFEGAACKHTLNIVPSSPLGLLITLLLNVDSYYNISYIQTLNYVVILQFFYNTYTQATSVDNIKKIDH